MPSSVSWRDARVLVTGGAGMIGANLVRRLIAHGCRPGLLVRASSSRLRLAGIEGAVDIVEADLTDASAVSEAVRAVRPDVVFHLASTFFNPPTLSAETHLRANALGTLALLEALKETPETRLVHTGSAAVTAGGARLREDAPIAPTTVFGAAKAAAAILGATYARVYGLGVVELRVFTPFGPWERPGRLIPYTILKALAGEPVDIGDGDIRRDYVYVDDAVEALLLAATRPVEPGSVINLASGVGRTVREVAERILAAMGDPVPLRVGARPTRPDEIREISGDTATAGRVLGWRARTGLDEGLGKAIAWFTDNRDVALRLA